MNAFLLLGLMSLAVYRLTRLVVRDTFPPVLWVRDRVAGGWRPLTESERSGPGKLVPEPHWTKIDGVLNRYVRRASWSPHWLAELLTCPWCASGWITGIVVLATDMTTGVPAPVLTGLSAWALGALLAARDWA